MVGYKDTSDVAKKAADDGAYLQNQKHKIQSNIFKVATPFF